jgi:hypothetical protein
LPEDAKEDIRTGKTVSFKTIRRDGTAKGDG